jgi:hypothetical protein
VTQTKNNPLSTLLSCNLSHPNEKLNKLAKLNRRKRKSQHRNQCSRRSRNLQDCTRRLITSNTYQASRPPLPEIEKAPRTVTAQQKLGVTEALTKQISKLSDQVEELKALLLNCKIDTTGPNVTKSSSVATLQPSLNPPPPPPPEYFISKIEQTTTVTPQLGEEKEQRRYITGPALAIQLEKLSKKGGLWASRQQRNAVSLAESASLIQMSSGTTSASRAILDY